MGTAYYVDSGASHDLFPYFSTFKAYHLLYNFYATLGDTTRLPIEGICTVVYTLNGSTILTRNALHIPALRGPLYSLCKHCQRPGCGVYSSYKDGSYLFLPEFILQVEYSYDNIVRYWPLGTSHQGPIDYIEHISTSSTAMNTPSSRPSTITPDPTPQSPHIITPYEEFISSQPPLPNFIDIDCLPHPLTNVPLTEPRDATLHKNSIEPLSIRTLNMVHRDATNLPFIPPSSTPAPCENLTKFESLNHHRIFGCRQFLNKKKSPQQTMQVW